MGDRGQRWLHGVSRRELLRHSRIAVVIFSGRGGSHTASSVEDVGLIGFLIVSIISIVVALV